MKKTIITVLAASLAVIALLASCRKIDEGDPKTTDKATDKTPGTTAVEVVKDIDPAKAAKDIISKTGFSVTLDSIDEANVQYIGGYDKIPAGTKCSVNMAAGANAEEVSVFKTDDTKTVADAVRAHVEAQKTAFASYKPEDMPKLDNAVIVEKSGVVVLVVTADYETAAKAVAEVIG